MSCLIEQQIHYRSTKHIFEKALATAGITLLTPANFAHFEEVAMSSMKLSVNKLATINRFVSYWEEKQPNFFEQSDEAVKKALSSKRSLNFYRVARLKKLKAIFGHYIFKKGQILKKI
jgi:DNA-3-methyladenine glycosylase II